MFVEGLDGLDEPFFNVEDSENVPEASMPHFVERLLKVNEVVEQVPLVLEMFFNEDPAVEDLFHCAPTCSEACLFF